MRNHQFAPVFQTNRNGIIRTSLGIIVLALMMTILTTSVQAKERPVVTKGSIGKGFELYHWKNEAGNSIFALLPGTNRNKTEAEVKKPENQILGTRELEKQFAELPVGMIVYGFYMVGKGFEFPDDKMIIEIVSAAKKAKIELDLH